MAFIRTVKTASGATAIQIAHKSYGRIIKIEHIGSAHSEQELSMLRTLAKQRLHTGQQSFFPVNEPSIQITLKQSFSTLLFQTLMQQYKRLGFKKLGDEDFAYLCIARIVEPTSKLDSLRVLYDLGLRKVSKDRLYRCLSKVVEKDYRSTVTATCFANAKSRGITLVLYDVTTLYFEIQKEDEYRKPGMSKERRLEPQIIVGLLVDQDGFPLGLHSFTGNTAETNTILPVLKSFCMQHKLKDMTVVADAAMLSEKNLQAIAAYGYHYIVGSRLRKIPYDIAEYQKTKELTDNQIFTTDQEDYRIIYQYKAKRAAFDIRNIKKQVAKAEKVLSGQTPAKKVKFLMAKTKEKKLNQKLIDKAYMLAGIKGYVTNLDIADTQVITAYHQLFQVEGSFRMAKSDLKARPIFHHKRDSIEAHLTIVLTALAIARKIEQQTKMSIKQFVKILRPIRSGVITIKGKEYLAEAEISEVIHNILKKIDTGH